MHLFYLISLLLVLHSWVWIAPAVGYSIKNCTVHGSLDYTDRLKVLCYNMKFLHVPYKLPQNVRGLDISGNHISQITTKDFQKLANLKVLNASQNFISHVEQGAFQDLVTLQELNLAKNKLTVLSRNLFQGLESLIVLQLGGNNISKIDPGAFRFFKHIRIVNLTSNNLLHLENVQPIIKSPDLQELYVGSNSFLTFQTEDLSDSPLELKLLDLSWNPLQIFNVTTDILPKLEALDLSHSGPNSGLQWALQQKYFLKDVKRLILNGTNVSRHELLSVLQSLSSSLEDLKLDNYNISVFDDLLKNICLSLPKLKILSLQGNDLSSLQAGLEPCLVLHELDLSRNKLDNLTSFTLSKNAQLRVLWLSNNQLSATPSAIQNFTSLEILDLSNNKINELKNSDFASLTKLKRLFIVNNLITIISDSMFKDLWSLQELKLGGNNILYIDSPFSSSLGKMEFLELRANKLTSIKNGTFKNLNCLTFLNLVDNQISVIEAGAFKGLVNLTTLLLGSNKITRDTLRTDQVFSGMPSLSELQLFDNYLEFYSSEKLESPPFFLLKSLKRLTFNSQGHDGLRNLPVNFLEGLDSLLELHAGNLNINFLDPNTFSYTPHLSFLDISKNVFNTLDPRVFQSVPNLTEFILSQARQQSFDFLIQANLTRVKILRGRGNELHVINKSLIQSLPALKYLDLQENAFTCDCDNAWFLNWSLHDSYTQVIYVNKFSCSYPSNLRGMKLVDLKVDSCTVDLEFICFISTTTLISFTLLVSFFYHFLRWQVFYAYYLFLAFVYDKKQKGRPLPRYEYDAFVSYNTHDELWVFRELLPQLEQDQGWKLCLHHRDFEPGRPIIDNIVDGIYKSRKTICLISRHYLESEWCSREIQVASFRLFDEQKDVLILVFLEDIPACQLSPYHRMRKLVKKRTYLAWPKHEQETRTFWQKLSIALDTREEPDEESPILSGLRTDK
ncbi:toll-like receptor 13 [Amia ocellicauda]|uniref:toll-like receptor 13 n=1 Tax=Amia ocellicauda TaxID=2972642 RepID=UPI003463D19E